MKVKIHLDTITDIGNFVVAVTNAVGKHDEVYVTDGGRCCINAKSFLGFVAAREFDELWCESEKDIYTAIQHFAVD
jgi:hypothetical protein